VLQAPVGQGDPFGQPGQSLPRPGIPAGHDRGSGAVDNPAPSFPGSATLPARGPGNRGWG
jgi:hypothetical protein